MFNRGTSLVILALLLLLTVAPIFAESGSANYTVYKNMIIAGTEIKAGEYQVKYQSNSPEVTVTFKAEGKVVATVKGKLEQLNKATDYTSLLVGKDSAGNDIIQALLFGGKKYRVVF